ncbi:hypothetical protein PaG_00666 [Moesziomyces aphidis]|uniref:Uncharacterized protein n=1 Tax=Moesziomyces aphidis TaxID=84754 RepID=W3VTA4_MOEAP|nr:hypothetical protein PaG_00666 [Moesziomyces aphidis]
MLSSAWHSPTAFPGSIVGAYNGTKALASPASPRDGVPILRDGIILALSARGHLCIKASLARIIPPAGNSAIRRDEMVPSSANCCPDVRSASASPPRDPTAPPAIRAARSQIVLSIVLPQWFCRLSTISSTVSGSGREEAALSNCPFLPEISSALRLRKSRLALYADVGGGLDVRGLEPPVGHSIAP